MTRVSCFICGQIHEQWDECPKPELTDAEKVQAIRDAVSADMELLDNFDLIDGGKEKAEEMVTISKKELDKLQRDSDLLECLRAGGVDNWDGWDDACEMFHEQNGEE